LGWRGAHPPTHNCRQSMRSAASAPSLWFRFHAHSLAGCISRTHTTQTHTTHTSTHMHTPHTHTTRARPPPLAATGLPACHPTLFHAIALLLPLLFSQGGWSSGESEPGGDAACGARGGQGRFGGCDREARPDAGGTALGEGLFAGAGRRGDWSPCRASPSSSPVAADAPVAALSMLPAGAGTPAVTACCRLAWRQPDLATLVLQGTVTMPEPWPLKLQR
jgi:hypothetical protein